MPTYNVAFWNLENLFAPEGFAGRVEWIARAVGRDLAGWSTDLFARKIDRLAFAIANLNDGAGPDLLGVCEVEHRFCLDALVARVHELLPARRYGVVHVDSTRDQRGIDTAFLYDTLLLEVDPAAIFSHWVMRRTGTRDITQATFRTLAGRDLIALVNHWPSRSGGHAVESQGFRATAGETLGYWHERIRDEKGADVAVLAMGDFNDEPWDASLTVHANASRERDDIERARSARFFNVGWEHLHQDVVAIDGRQRRLYGTLYFGGDGFHFDQMLASPSLLTGRSGFNVRESSFRIESFPAMVGKSKNEGPIRFGLPNGDPDANVNPDGFSDHFPVSVVIDENA
jgi:endonuclease/exonuclease/phosphatase family metal-dependent hydrolase